MVPDRQPRTARTCRCEHPLLSDDTCLRCGRALRLVKDTSSLPGGREITWTRAHVARAFQAFAFFRGRAPVAADWNRRMSDWPSLETVEGLFGTVEAATQAAGLQRSPTNVP